MNANNPFYKGSFDGRCYGAVTAQDRIEMVKQFNADQCFAALGLDHLQSTVERALRQRLRVLLAGIVGMHVQSDRDGDVNPNQVGES